MKTFWLQVLAIVCGAAIVGGTAQLWKVNERLARIETRLGMTPAIAANTP